MKIEGRLAQLRVSLRRINDWWRSEGEVFLEESIEATDLYASYLILEKRETTIEEELQGIFGRVIGGIVARDLPGNRTWLEIVSVPPRAESFEPFRAMMLETLAKYGFGPIGAGEANEAKEPARQWMAKERQQRRKRVKELFEAGCSDQEIANTLSVSVSTVQRDRKDQGLVKRRSK